MTFSKALESIKKGHCVSRTSWNGKGQYVFLIPELFSSDRIRIEPFIAIQTVQNTTVPWLASQTDLLAEDWIQTAL
jgi:hypothetical protein